jgi:CRP-like cAMP-binding protein
MPAQNRLLGAIPADVLERLQPNSKTVELAHGQVLHEPRETIAHVYFPLTSLISVTLTMIDGRTSEVGVVGSREMVGINAFMGGEETNETCYVAQVAGSAVRIPAEPLLAEFDSNKAFRDVMLRYTQAYLAQISQNVSCNRLHSLNQRLARWLLESTDRIQSDHLVLSQEFVAEMLGVRRASVTEAAASLREAGVIDTGRNDIRIIDVVGLTKFSCECYGVLLDEYERLLGPMPSKTS